MRERGCVFFIRFFELKVKKKMNEGERAGISVRVTESADREKNIVV
jgi:hypothetical protein